VAGVYISYPFCAQKCTYCNFASGVFPRELEPHYLDALRREIAAHEWRWQPKTVYLGGGTPSLIDPEALRLLLDAVPGRLWREATMEAAPGTVTLDRIRAWRECGINRVSLGVQSFVQTEIARTGRKHTAEIIEREVALLREHGIDNINIDLIAGLPHQTAESWTFSLSETIATGVPHVSVYMLEVDEDSRLGRELIAGGTRYHAHFVPDEEATSDFYLQACDSLNAVGIRQYEISNFARSDGESRHNLKYWTRQPYIGFGVDAHSMLFADDASEIKALRFSAPDSLDSYMSRGSSTVTPVSEHGALEESFFLGLRLNQGVDLERLRARFRRESVDACELAIAECIREGLLEKRGIRIYLRARGRLLSNEVFGKFLTDEKAAGVESV